MQWTQSTVYGALLQLTTLPRLFSERSTWDTCVAKSRSNRSTNIAPPHRTSSPVSPKSRAHSSRRVKSGDTLSGKQNSQPENRSNKTRAKAVKKHTQVRAIKSRRTEPEALLLWSPSRLLTCVVGTASERREDGKSIHSCPLDIRTLVFLVICPLANRFSNSCSDMGPSVGGSESGMARVVFG